MEADAKHMPLLSILCVDDDQDNLAIALLALRLDGTVSALGASSALEALRILTSPHYKPDCIMLDVSMPDEDGKVLLGEIRGLPHHRQTPVIFLTARVGEAERQSHLALGACGTIAKPFDPINLTSQVRQMLLLPSPPLENPKTSNG